ncbi:MAG: hypothetical protein KDC05_12845 [Bacteroidales bacterium]|nr:hypothetical protein [Bacteroidales bacterium]
MKMILETDNPKILESITLLFKKEPAIDFWDTLQQDQKDDIMEGINEIENGDTMKYEEFMKKHRP